jgi:hypothetical protein
MNEDEAEEKIGLEYFHIWNLPGTFILDLVRLDRREDFLQERKLILHRILD